MPQMRGAGMKLYKYRESFATKQMRHNGLTQAVFSAKQRHVFLVIF